MDLVVDLACEQGDVRVGIGRIMIREGIWILVESHGEQNKPRGGSPNNSVAAPTINDRDFHIAKPIYAERPVRRALQEGLIIHDDVDLFCECIGGVIP